MEDPEQKPRFASEVETAVAADTAYVPRGYEFSPEYATEGDRAARFARLRKSASVAGRVACVAVGAAGGLYFMLNGAHYETEQVADTGLRAEITVNLHDGQNGIFGETNFGKVEFRDVTDLPVGVHAMPVVNMNAPHFIASSGGMSGVVDKTAIIKSAAISEAKGAGMYFGKRAGVGLFGGALAGSILNELAATTYGAYRGKLPRKEDLPRKAWNGVLQTAAGGLVTAAAIGGVGYASYNHNWMHNYKATDMLADFSSAPQKINELFERDEHTAAYMSSTLQVWDALSQPAPAVPGQAEDPPAFGIMTISDLHNRDAFPYLWKDIKNPKYNVKLVLFDGDAVELGHPQELRPKFLHDLKKTASMAPVVAIRGNHDPSSVGEVLDKVPNVYVLEDETINAYGLQIAGIPDPTGDMPEGGPSKSEDRKAVELQDADTQAAKTNDRNAYFDLVMTHDPDELDRLQQIFGSSMRAGTAGHVHQQNDASDIQKSGRIRLIEGTTGMGGVIRRYYNNMPGNGVLSYSVLNVSQHCQFTGIERWNKPDPVLQAIPEATPLKTPTFMSMPLERQAINPERTCSVEQGIGAIEPLDSPDLPTAEDYGAQPKDAQQAAPSQTPTPSR